MIDSNVKAHLRAILKDAIKRGLFDSILFVPVNKGDVYHKLPPQYRQSVAQSFFYKLISDRRIYLFERPSEAESAFAAMVFEISKAEDVSCYEFHIIKKTIGKFNAHINSIGTGPGMSQQSFRP